MMLWHTSAPLKGEFPITLSCYKFVLMKYDTIYPNPPVCIIPNSNTVFIIYTNRNIVLLLALWLYAYHSNIMFARGQNCVWAGGARTPVAHTCSVIYLVLNEEIIHSIFKIRINMELIFYFDFWINDYWVNIYSICVNEYFLHPSYLTQYTGSWEIHNTVKFE